MNTQEISQKYGVPMPETCKKLNWRESNYSWQKCQTNKGIEYALYYKIRNIDYFAAANFDVCLAVKIGDLIPAPQMHEMIAAIPTMQLELLIEIGRYVYEQYDNIAEKIAKLIINNKHERT